MATSFSGGRSRSTRREPPTMGKQLVSFIPCGCITVGRRFDYNDEKFTNFVNLINENFKSPAFRGPLNFLPFLGKLPGDLFGDACKTKYIDLI
jgi:hypothetical protein